MIEAPLEEAMSTESTSVVLQQMVSCTIHSCFFEKYLDRLDRWACADLMKFNKAECTVLHIDQGNPKHKYRLGKE